MRGISTISKHCSFAQIWPYKRDVLWPGELYIYREALLRYTIGLSKHNMQSI